MMTSQLGLGLSLVFRKIHLNTDNSLRLCWYCRPPLLLSDFFWVTFQIYSRTQPHIWYQYELTRLNRPCCQRQSRNKGCHICFCTYTKLLLHVKSRYTFWLIWCIGTPTNHIQSLFGFVSTTRFGCLPQQCWLSQTTKLWMMIYWLSWQCWQV